MCGAAPLRNFDLAGALADAEERFSRRNPASRARHEQAGRVMPGGNTRTVLHYKPFPLTFRSGRGALLDDLDGHTYTDFLGEYSAALYGHSHPVIVAAVTRALRDGIALGGPNLYEAELAALVCERFPGCELVRFCNSGTEANLLAVATARAVTGRPGMLVFGGGYHGSMLKYTDEASPLNVPFPATVAPFNDTDATLELIARDAPTLAAILVEPMQASGGAITADPEFLRALRVAADRHGIVLIFDEIVTSRLAPGGLQAELDITPDMTTFGKYLGGGLTFGAFAGSRRLMDRFDPTKSGSLAHAGTFNNSVLTMAAGLAGLRDIFIPEVAREINFRGDRLRDRLNAIFTRSEVEMQAIGLGSVANMHFQSGPILRAENIAAAREKRALLHLHMIERGYYLARRGYLTLSLVMTDEHIEGFISAVEEFVGRYDALLRVGSSS